MKGIAMRYIVPLGLVLYSTICYSQGAVAPDMEVIKDYWSPYAVDDFSDSPSPGLAKSTGFWNNVWNWAKENPTTAVTAILTGDVTSVTATYIAEKSTELTIEMADEFIETVTPDPYPSYFDLRDYHLVSDIDEQDGGTCVPYSIKGGYPLNASAY